MSYLLSSHRETWLQKNALMVMSVLSALGALLTAYLTYGKWTQQPVALCGAAGGCDLVLSSRWAEFLGLPTALWGFVGFGAMLTLAVLPETIAVIKKWRWLALFTGVTAMMAFEVYMAYLMIVELKQFCLYCSLSIALVTGMWITVLFGRRWLERGQLLMWGSILSLLTLVVTHGVYMLQTPPADPLALQVAAQLRSIQGTMYGAHWCPHCQEQKALFGKAFEQVPYVECSPQGGPGTPQAQECRDKGITSYPTWVINGITYRGLRSIEDLARISGLPPSAN